MRISSSLLCCAVLCWGDATDGRDVLRQKSAGRAGVFGKPISIGGRAISRTTLPVTPLKEKERERVWIYSVTQYLVGFHCASRADQSTACRVQFCLSASGRIYAEEAQEAPRPSSKVLRLCSLATYITTQRKRKREKEKRKKEKNAFVHRTSGS